MRPDSAPSATAQPRASDTAGIGPSLRRTRVWAVVMIVVGVLAGIAALGTYGALDQHYRAEQRKLPRYPGSITSVRSTDSESSGGEVDVRWDQDGARWRATIHVGNAGSWHDGQSVPVVVDPERPDFATLPGENYKPESFDFGFGALGFACAGLIIGSGVWCTRLNAKLRRSDASAWRTVEARFVETRGENGGSTMVYIPEFARDRLWLVKGKLPQPRARVQIAGHEFGLVVRLGEDDALMLAEPKILGAPVTARVSGYHERDSGVAFRLEAGDKVYFVAGRRDHLAPDVGDLARVRAATIRTGSNGVVLVQLGISREPSFFRTLAEKQARKTWPPLFEPSARSAS